MNKKFILGKRILLSFTFASLISPTLFSCATSSVEDSTTYIYVLNAEDYIDDSLFEAFEQEVKETDGKKVKVVYETYDTNETMYNTLKTGKQTYDMICCSDYMIQRLAREGMLHSFEDGLDSGKLDNYKYYVSPFLADYSENSSKSGAKLNEIPVKIPTDKKDSDGNVIYDESKFLSDYAIGYMWGTLGILYNPNLIIQRNGDLFRSLNEEYKNLSDEELKDIIIEGFRSVDGYSKLWAKEFNKTQSIKDSMRDTYAIGIFERYKELFDPTSPKYINDYHERNEQFNKCDDETIKQVQETLIDLKQNIFGFEVDSGKDDIVTQKIGVNIAWSGDAVNSIGRGYYADDDWTEPWPEEKQVELYYNIPKIGANVWFDAWCLPQREDSYYDSDQYNYTLKFLDFLNNPQNAVANMSYNGYTTFIGSTNETLDALGYFLYSYGLTEEEAKEYEDGEVEKYDISYYFNFENENDEPLKELEVNAYDILSYDSYEEALADDDVKNFVFKDEDGDGKLDIYVLADLSSYEGRSLVAQLPQTSDKESLYVMRDFENQNNKIVTMWENVKVNPLPIWVVVTLVIFLVATFSYLGCYKFIKKYRVKKRKQLRKEIENS